MFPVARARALWYRWAVAPPNGTPDGNESWEGPGMVPLDDYRITLRYHGWEGLSQVGFKRYDARLNDLFPTADEVVLSMKAYFQRLDEAAALMYEVPGTRFGIVENEGLLELAVPDPRGDYSGVIIDILARDLSDARLMMADIEEACGFVRARVRDALGIMDMTADDYQRRLQDSLRLLANELRR
jgi:hypothetical protein